MMVMAVAVVVVVTMITAKRTGSPGLGGAATATKQPPKNVLTPDFDVSTPGFDGGGNVGLDSVNLSRTTYSPPPLPHGVQVLARAAGGGCAGCAVMVPLREVGASSATFTGRLITAGNASAALAALLLPSPYAAVDVVYSDAAPEGLAVAHFRPCSPGAASIGPALSMAGSAAGAARNACNESGS